MTQPLIQWYLPSRDKSNYPSQSRYAVQMFAGIPFSQTGQKAIEKFDKIAKYKHWLIKKITEKKANEILGKDPTTAIEEEFKSVDKKDLTKYTSEISNLQTELTDRDDLIKNFSEQLKSAEEDRKEAEKDRKEAEKDRKEAKEVKDKFQSLQAKLAKLERAIAKKQKKEAGG